jgi:uncharacterized lipoprotein YajG
MLNIALCITALSGCAAQTFIVNGDIPSKATTQESQTFFISGLGQEQITDAAAVCGGSQNIIKVQAKICLLFSSFR